MYFGIQPNLVERAVFEAVRKDASLRPRYERQFSDCYQYPDGARRDQAFAELHEWWFNELGLHGLISGLVNEFAHFRVQVSRLMVTQAPGRNAQTAELFGSPGQYTVVVGVSASMLLDRPAFQFWARHEFLHIDDMLDPAFEYDSDHRPTGATAAARNLAQDRYAVLWALSIDARLVQRGLAPPEIRERRRADLMRAFALSHQSLTESSFNELWEKGTHDRPSHRLLMEWAQFGVPGITSTGASRRDAGEQPTAGAPCPLCAFPTHDWADVDQCHDVYDAVRRDYPTWGPTQGLCSRCSEVYRSCDSSVRTVQV